MTRQPVLPNARAAAFTAVCVGLGAGAHLHMSATPIPSWSVLVAVAAVYVAARMVTAGRERSLLCIMALMGAAQVFLHLLFSFAQNLAAAGADTIVSGNAVIVQLPSMPLPGSAPMSSMASMPSMQSMPGMDMSSGAASYVGGAMHMGPGMLMAHAAAALICSWWLRRGEAALHRVVRTAARWLRRRAGWQAPLRPRQLVQLRPACAPAAAIRFPRLRSSLYVNVLARRGPPVRLMPCS